ncbi:putative zinc finger motif, C2HC5-type-domain-containing protein [Xylogone sp. PMI_703]|nr:putative zinc finger motif, C2HC5-type-domain-containing protein [Xylogone sp. PMI_703]
MSLAQLSRLLPLPEADLQQVLDYASTLSKEEAAEHFNNLLGESPQSIEFISSFNARRKDPSPPTVQASSSTPPRREDLSEVPKPRPHGKKKKANIHTPAPRQVQGTFAGSGTAYMKKNEEDYVPNRRPTEPPKPSTSNLTIQPAKPSTPQPRKPPPSASGPLISDLKSKSTPTSRTSSPGPQATTKTKISITGGTSMHGASTVLSELDSAIRALEISTNSTLSSNDNAKRRCNCVATRHPLLTAAPNCLNCGKVICVKEGLGPCTFCGTPLLSSTEVQGMIRELKEERGREKMALDASAHRKADVSRNPAPFSKPASSEYLSPAEAAAKEHRDKLLAFQAQNAKRTTVKDEAADFDVSMARGSGGNMWASPAERARELKRQQKILREMEWNARPDYEKRQQVVSIDLVRGKVVKRMAAVEKPVEVESEEEEETPLNELSENSGNVGGGAFSRNPLLGGLIKPVYNIDKSKGKGKENGETPDNEVRRKKTWRRVQDDFGDNEAIILDGGVLGGNLMDRSEEQPAYRGS